MTREEIIKKRYELLAKTLLANLNQRGFNATYAKDSKEAIKQALDYLPKNKTISWGGCQTLQETGLLDYFRSHEEYKVIDRSLAKSPEEMDKLSHMSAEADYFIASANACSLQGELIEIDGRSNRISAICYQAHNVLFLIGMNKVALDYPSALQRARNIAAPLNAIRLGKNTPCAKLGYCTDCHDPNSICSNIVTLRKPNIPGRYRVILIGEDLGY